MFNEFYLGRVVDASNCGVIVDSVGNNGIRQMILAESILICRIWRRADALSYASAYSLNPCFRPPIFQSSILVHLDYSFLQIPDHRICEA